MGILIGSPAGDVALGALAMYFLDPQEGRTRRARLRDKLIRLEHVSFAYAGRRGTLRDVTFAVPAGSRVGIVGPTGAGKSTLLSLLPRLRRSRVAPGKARGAAHDAPAIAPVLELAAAIEVGARRPPWRSTTIPRC